MLYINYRKTFERTPNLKALWERMLQFSNEYCGFVLVSDRPFLITHYGRASDDPVGGMGLVKADSVEDQEVLWEELLLLERLLRERSIEEDEIVTIDKRSAGLPGYIDEIRDIYDLRISLYLKSTTALH